LNEKLKKATEQENDSKKKIIMLDREIEKIQEQKVEAISESNHLKTYKTNLKEPNLYI
jgi:hypothetical protein